MKIAYQNRRITWALALLPWLALAALLRRLA